MLKIYGAGRLVSDPEMRNVTSKRTGEVRSLCTVRIASDNDYPSEETSFIRINAWGPRAIYLYKAGQKGIYIEFDGELRIPPYDKDKERQYEPVIEIGSSGHLNILILQKQQGADTNASSSVSEQTPIEPVPIYTDYSEEDLPFFGDET